MHLFLKFDIVLDSRLERSFETKGMSSRSPFYIMSHLWRRISTAKVRAKKLLLAKPTSKELIVKVNEDFLPLSTVLFLIESV